MTAASVLWARALDLAAHDGLSCEEIAARLSAPVEQVEFWLRRPVERLSFAPRPCAGCGEPFVPAGAHQHYCCPEHRPPRHQRRCAYCRRPLPAHAEGQHYCCPEHERAHVRRPTANTIAAWAAHVQALEDELARLRGYLDAPEERAA